MPADNIVVYMWVISAAHISLGHIPLYAPTKAISPSNRKTTADIVCNGSCHVECVVSMTRKEPNSAAVTE